MRINGHTRDTVFQSGHVSLIPAAEDPRVISAAIEPFTSEDFAAARANPNAPSEYATVASAEQKLRTLSPYGFWYAVTVENCASGSTFAAGMANLMDINPHLVHKVLRKVGVDARDTRTVNGWLNTTEFKDHIDVTRVATETVDLLLRAGRTLGMHAVDAVVMPEGEGKNVDLVVVEHAADLAGLGFVPDGDVEFIDQGIAYAGLRWRYKF